MTDTQSFIPGAHFFCDHRCWRCPLAPRCRVHDRWSRIREPASARRQPAARVALVVKTALDVTLEELEIVAGQHGVAMGSEIDAADAGSSGSGEGAAMGADAANFDADAARAEQAIASSPLVQAADQYAHQSWAAVRALRGVLAARRDRDGLDACDRLEEMCFTIASKAVRCVASAARAGDDLDDVQSDANGSAKVALLLIEESRQAWRALMAPGRARGGGAPAGFIRMLDGLETALLDAFPRAFEFVRPGFDTGGLDGDAGAVARAVLAAGTAGKGHAN